MARLLPSFLVNVVLAALALGAAGWATMQVRDGATATTTAASGSRTVTVGRGTVTATVSADGSLEPVTTATASFATAGTVTAVSVKVGDRVTKGQLLAKVDPAAAQRSLDLAKANRTAAQDAVNRATAAGTDTATARNELTTAQIAVDTAQAGVEGTQLTAPMTGTITALNGTVGSSASSATSSGSSGSTGASGAGGSGSTSGSGSSSAAGFVEIADLTGLQVSAAFGEADATQVKAGQTASITWSALNGATATGQVLAVDPSATTSNSVVSYGVTTSIAALPTGARAGQSVTVSVTTGTARNALMVNSAAVTVSGSRYTVTVLGTGGTRATTAVRVGVKGDTAYEITSGLVEGEQVVVPQSSTTSSSGSSGLPGQGPGGGGLGGTGGGPGGAGGGPP